MSLVGIDKLILKYMGMQSAKHSQNNIEEEQTYRTNSIGYQDLSCYTECRIIVKNIQIDKNNRI